VDYLYSLYDALVSINVPNDKARAVVDAMERDMGTALATKADLHLLRQELTFSMNTDVQSVRQELKGDLQSLRQDLKADIGALRQEMRDENAQIRQDIALIHKEMEFLATSITVRLGSVMVLALGVMFAALKLT
jgi:hypothetical protein